MKRALLAGLIVLLAGHLAAAATIQMVGSGVIEPAANQVVSFTVYSDGVMTTRDVTLYNSLVGGPSADLVFTAYDFRQPGYMFASSTWFVDQPLQTDLGGTQAGDGDTFGPFGAPQLVPGTVASPVGLVDIILDASAAPLGTWDLTFSAWDNSRWILDAVGSTNEADFASLIFPITVAPEPAVLLQLLALAGMGCVGFIVRRRKRRLG
jgi:hypothetical protein